MTPSELVEYYRASDVYVMPTREDIWGLVVNEALAEGLPVITSDKCTSGNEIVKNAQNGYVYSCEKTDELAEKIRWFENNGDALANYSQNAIDSIKNYSFETVVKMHTESIERLVTEKAQKC